MHNHGAIQSDYLTLYGNLFMMSDVDPLLYGNNVSLQIKNGRLPPSSLSIGLLDSINPVNSVNSIVFISPKKDDWMHVRYTSKKFYIFKILISYNRPIISAYSIDLDDDGSIISADGQNFEIDNNDCHGGSNFGKGGGNTTFPPLYLFHIIHFLNYVYYFYKFVLFLYIYFYMFFFFFFLIVRTEERRNPTIYGGAGGTCDHLLLNISAGGGAIHLSTRFYDSLNSKISANGINGGAGGSIWLQVFLEIILTVFVF